MQGPLCALADLERRMHPERTHNGIDDRPHDAIMIAAGLAVINSGLFNAYTALHEVAASGQLSAVEMTVNVAVQAGIGAIALSTTTVGVELGIHGVRNIARSAYKTGIGLARTVKRRLATID